MKWKIKRVCIFDGRSEELQNTAKNKVGAKSAPSAHWSLCPFTALPNSVSNVFAAGTVLLNPPASRQRLQMTKHH